MPTRRQLALALNNHTGEELGDIPNHIRTDYEDSLIQALEDTIVDGNQHAFKSFLQVWARRVFFPPEIYQACMHDETFCWYTVFQITCGLRRMNHRYEYCANQLLNMGVPKEDIPEGMEYINQ